MAFCNFLNRLRNLSSPEVREEDEGSPVDEEEGDVDAESDIEFECGDGESGEESDGTESCIGFLGPQSISDGYYSTQEQL
ncbi:hypothetical protein RRG08_007419 [Elysia crispata]|uniref:Uncharacterized protein n=1 Tax=Elysia crispata TaxID=231223 RepID=A0AAE1AMT3_9GAST|nr:hypothetical protein RRG08_007419 [Elysia crispata]